MSDTLFDAEAGGSGGVAAASDAAGAAGAPRLVSPNRSQMELRAVDLEGLLPADHAARGVWEFVESLDLSAVYGEIGSVEGHGGRPATDPRVLMALWVYATTEGVGSARALARLCEQHDAYRWICGGVSVNYHTLSDFRVRWVDWLDEVLTHSVAVLMDAGVVQLKRVSQDGTRVRASAGAASFRREPSLKRCLREAERQVERLRWELEEDPEATSRRQVAARQRAAEERRRRVTQALEQLPKVAAKKKPAEKDQARVSTTDAEARVMKMADGGFRPAFNAQFAVDTETQIIVGVAVTNVGSDQGEMVPMIEQLEQRYQRVPGQTLVDGGFAALDQIERATKKGTEVYAPVTKPRDPERDPHAPLPSDSAEIADWRQRMGSTEAQQIYKERAATSECVNAIARNRGLQQFRVRGLRKARAVLLWYGIAHNFMRRLSLAAAQQALAT